MTDNQDGRFSHTPTSSVGDGPEGLHQESRCGFTEAILSASGMMEKRQRYYQKRNNLLDTLQIRPLNGEHDPSSKKQRTCRDLFDSPDSIFASILGEPLSKAMTERTRVSS